MLGLRVAHGRELFLWLRLLHPVRSVLERPLGTFANGTKDMHGDHNDNGNDQNKAHTLIKTGHDDLPCNEQLTGKLLLPLILFQDCQTLLLYNYLYIL